MILHHYLASPFAEKIRLMMAYSGMAWQSSIVPPYPPRKTVDQLTGGYRRVPIAQQGADIYCDSNLIAEELAMQCGKPALEKASLSRADQQFMQNIEREMLFACLLSAPWYKGLPALIRTQGPRYMFGLMRDRKKMLRSAAIPIPNKKVAKAQVAAYLADCERRLDNLYFGGKEPSLLDFAVYAPLWARISVFKIKLPAEYSSLNEWFERMSSFARQVPPKVDSEVVFEAAAQEAKPLPKSLPHERLGKLVTIQPTDYAQDEVSGVLVCATKTRLVLEVASSKSGRLNIHFPRFGYRLM